MTSKTIDLLRRYRAVVERLAGSGCIEESDKTQEERWDLETEIDALLSNAHETNRCPNCWKPPGPSEWCQHAFHSAAHETKPSRDADHCDYPDCEQHWRYVAQLAFNHVDMGQLRVSHIKDWHVLNAAFGIPEKTESVQTQVPIVRIKVGDGFINSAEFLAPGLPDGTHDLFCASPDPRGGWVPAPWAEIDARLAKLKRYEAEHREDRSGDPILPEMVECEEGSWVAYEDVEDLLDAVEDSAQKAPKTIGDERLRLSTGELLCQNVAPVRAPFDICTCCNCTEARAAQKAGAKLVCGLPPGHAGDCVLRQCDCESCTSPRK